LPADSRRPATGWDRWASTAKANLSVVGVPVADSCTDGQARQRHPEPVALLRRRHGRQQRGSQVRLVDQQQRVGADEGGVDRAAPVADPVAAEQQPATDLVDGAQHNAGPFRAVEPG
jgi:hypothetical protein